MRDNKFLTFKTALILLTFLLPSCEEKQEQECDAICEAKKADFELLTNAVDFENKGGILRDGFNFSFYVYKTDTGAIARYDPFYGERVEAELSPEEWLNFIKALYKCLNKDLNEREGKDNYCYGTISCTRLLYINYLDSSENTWKSKPTDWDMVEKTISDIMQIMRKRAEVPIDAKLRAEYKKRFGEPITDVELSTNGIYFLFVPNEKEKDRKSIFYVLVNRTETGAVLRYRNMPEVELDIGEWLDFMRAIHKSGINKWDRQYGGDSDSIPDFYEFYRDSVSKLDERWKLEIYYSDKAGFSIVEGYDAYPPNWDEFMRIMDGMKAKIKEKTSLNLLLKSSAKSLKIVR